MDKKENLRKHSQRLWRTQDKEEKSTQSGKFLPEKALLQAHLVGHPPTPLPQMRGCLRSRMLPIFPSQNGSFYCALPFIVYCEFVSGEQRWLVISLEQSHLDMWHYPSHKGASLQSNWIGFGVVSPGEGGAYVWEYPKIIGGQKGRPIPSLASTGSYEVILLWTCAHL